jgi:hypothetical protein
MDRQQLWTQFVNSGDLPSPNQPIPNNTFRNKVTHIRYWEVYKVVYSHLSANPLRELNFDNWQSIISSNNQFSIQLLRAKKNLNGLLTLLPCLCFFIENKNCPSNAQVKAIELILQSPLSLVNVSEAKRQTNLLHIAAWSRSPTDKEKQGGVSVLGSISEKLIQTAMGSLVDGTELFKSNNNDIKSYGDFVLMALPNNLWFSVKSAFSRERLLASGYSNDLIGIGFFSDYREFTSPPKIRNFKKAGFLAIYLPDTPVNAEQYQTNTNTYDQVASHYAAPQNSLTTITNINGNPFFRKLSELGTDIAALKSRPIHSRTTIDF